jgi:hypothetical protein
MTWFSQTKHRGQEKKCGKQLQTESDLRIEIYPKTIMGKFTSSQELPIPNHPDTQHSTLATMWPNTDSPYS